MLQYVCCGCSNKYSTCSSSICGLLATEDERSVLGSMLRFMRVTKKARHNPESEGIYLEDLNLEELDPEVAALYFPRNSRAPDKNAGEARVGCLYNNLN